MKTKIFFTAFILSILLVNCSTVKELTLEEKFLLKKNEFTEKFDIYKADNNLPRNTKIELVNVDYEAKVINIDFSRDFSFIPLREDNVQKMYSEVKTLFGEQFSDYDFVISSMKYPIEELIPNYYRSDKNKIDNSRLPKQSIDKRISVVTNLSKKYNAANGLDKMNILLWQSHGWYYDNKEKRWEWQRPRIFQTIEDLLPTSFTIPYLIPMLENSGANVFVSPRERYSG